MNDPPSAIQRDLQWLEHPVRSQHQQDQRHDLKSPVPGFTQVEEKISVDEIAESPRKVIRQCFGQGKFRKSTLSLKKSSQRKHRRQEGIQAEHHARSNREGVDMYFRL